jgi:hypothetical protein
VVFGPVHGQNLVQCFAPRIDQLTIVGVQPHLEECVLRARPAIGSTRWPLLLRPRPWTRHAGGASGHGRHDEDPSRSRRSAAPPQYGPATNARDVPPAQRAQRSTCQIRASGRNRPECQLQRSARSMLPAHVHGTISTATKEPLCGRRQVWQAPTGQARIERQHRQFPSTLDDLWLHNPLRNPDRGSRDELHDLR